MKKAMYDNHIWCCSHCQDERFLVDKKGYCQNPECGSYNSYFDYTNTFALFEGRHDLPENKGAIVGNFDFKEWKNEYTPNLNVVKELLEEDKTYVYILVTGLTPALTLLMKELGYHSSIVLCHYNKEQNNYIEQML